MRTYTFELSHKEDSMQNSITVIGPKEEFDEFVLWLRDNWANRPRERKSVNMVSKAPCNCD